MNLNEVHGVKSPIYKMVGYPIIELEPIQTDLQAALSNFNAPPIENAPVIADAEALSE